MIDSTITPPSFLKPFTETFFGIQGESSESIQKRDALYHEFLAMNQLHDSDIQQATPEQQAAYLVQFAQFLERQLANIYQVESLVALSPEEMARRNILFEAFSTILKMLHALQDNIRAISQALVFYTKWQDQYTSMMTKVPLYIPNLSPTGSYNALDFGKTTLGYGNIRIEDIIKFFLNSARDKIYSGQSGVLVQNLGPDLAFHFYYSPGNIGFLLLQPQSDGGAKTIFEIGAEPPSTPGELMTILPTIVKKMQSVIQTTQGELQDLYRSKFAANNFQGLAWGEPVYEDSDDDTKKARAGLRGEINGKLQLCIENIRSLRQQVKDRMQPVQDILSQTREAIQSQSNLLGSMIDSMKGLISAIFR